MQVLLDIFGNAKGLPLGEPDDLIWVYWRVRDFRATLRSSVYRANAFRKIVVAARLFTNNALWNSRAAWLFHRGSDTKDTMDTKEIFRTA